MPRTIVFVDGFNLYYSCLRGTAFKWLDVVALFRDGIVKVQDAQTEVTGVRYFTAPVKASYASHGVASEQAQTQYHRALMARHPDALQIVQHPGFDQADKALPIAQSITRIAPDQLNGWELVAAANLELKNYKDAVSALEKGLATISAPKDGAQPSAIYLRIQKRIESYREKLATAARQ